MMKNSYEFPISSNFKTLDNYKNIYKIICSTLIFDTNKHSSQEKFVLYFQNLGIIIKNCMSS